MRRIVRRGLAAALAIGADSSAAGAQDIDTLALRAHATALAHDSLQGRANGTRGQHAAAAYIESELRALGLEPRGDRGTFRQRLPLVRVSVAPRETRLVVRSGGVERRVDGDLFHHAGGDSLSFRPFEGRILDVGSVVNAIGATSAQGSLRGTVVLAAAAPGVPLDSVARVLEARGAEGLVVTLADSMRYRGLRNARGPHRYFLRERTASPLDRSLPVLVAGPAAGQTLRDAAAQGPAATVELETQSRFDPMGAWNVVAALPGADSLRRDEAVVFVAHYDHIGFASPAAGDSLYNGFVDNATGVAAVLSIARALRESPPPRTTIFLFVAAEEEGSLGSAYHAAQPAVPLDRTIAAINLDHPPPLAPSAKWFVEASDAPALRGAIARVGAARRWQIEVAPPQPTSDHWSFHARGVPAAFVVPGEGWTGVTAEQEGALIARWWRPHRPDDAWAPDFPWAGLGSMAELALALGRELATSTGGGS